MLYEMKLQPQPFVAVKNGSKIIESRLFDEKRQLINLGDQILFKNIDNLDDTVLTKVNGLLRYETFSAMFNDFPALVFGGESKSMLEKQIYSFYSKDDERKYGVLGIRITKIDKE
jgi:ASC-1-like (ASCH) protein